MAGAYLFYSEIDEEFRAWIIGTGAANNDLHSLWKSGCGIAKRIEVDLLAAAPGAAMKGRVKDDEVFDFPNCVNQFDLDVRKTKRTMAVSLEGEEEHE